MATFHSTSKARLARNRRSKPRNGKHVRAQERTVLNQRKTGGALPRVASRRRSAKQDSKKSQESDRETGMRIRGRLREFLSAEQGFLLTAESLLLCVAKSMDDSAHPSTGPYYPDVIELAAKLLRRRADSIDELLLDGRLPGG